MSKKQRGKKVKREDGANRVKCCGCRIQILKDLWVHNWEATGGLEESVIVGLNSEGRVNSTKKEGGEEVRK